MCGREEKYMILNIERRSRQTENSERSVFVEVCGHGGYTMGIIK